MLKISKKNQTNNRIKTGAISNFPALGAEAAKNALMMSLTGKQPPLRRKKYKSNIKIEIQVQ